MEAVAIRTKVCPGCKKELPHAEEYFYKVTNTKNVRWKYGLYPRCKECVKNYQKRWYITDDDRRRAKIRQSRVQQLARYGLTIDEYAAKLARQEGLCDICKQPPKDGISLCVDHDHKSGFVRNLLCFACNVSVGYLETDPIRFDACKEYLIRHGK